MAKFEDLTGQKFGKLTVIERAEDYVFPNGTKRIQWLCKCDCGNERKAISKFLKNGTIKSCGCLRYNRKDLTGLRFGRLLVLNRNELRKKYWDCQCDCGNKCTIHMSQLQTGDTKSCGCIRKEMAYNQCKKYNEYEVQEDYVIMYTTKNEPFYVDIEDFWKVRYICWHKDEGGYLVGSIEKGHILLHRLIMDASDDMLVDHIHGEPTRNDNRKSNLRIATYQENAMNHGVAKDNTSGITGVNWHKTSNKWRAYIGINGKNIHLGSFDSFEDAINARKIAEEKYFGEWSYSNSQEINGRDLE